MADGGYLVKDTCEESLLPEYPMKKLPEHDDFEKTELGIYYYSPRYSSERFTNLKSRPGYLRMRRQQCLSSYDKGSLLARKLTAFSVEVSMGMEFVPESYRQSAGLVVYYDNLNFIYLRKYYSESLKCCALSITHLELEQVVEDLDCFDYKAEE